MTDMLDALIREREPSLIRLMRERDPSADDLVAETCGQRQFYPVLAQWVCANIAEDIAAHRVRAGIERKR
jgi:hypothetical protein